MKKYYLLPFISIFLITILSTELFSKENKIQKLKEQILILYSEDIYSRGSSKLDDFLLDIKNQSLSKKETIELYVELLDYYIGEGPGEILTMNVSCLGEEVLPYLIEKKNSPLKIDKKYKNMYYETIEERNARIINAINSIKNGIIFYAEYPDSSLLNKIVKEDQGIINIFLNDYKKNYNKNPDDLFKLKDYAYKSYGYKLRIHNPWGDLYEYKRK